MKPNLVAILLIVIILSYPVEALLLRRRWRWQALVFGGNVLLIHILFLMMIHDGIMERFQKDKMDYFPWNEVNLVIKRFPESTVVECGWNLPSEPTPNFQENDVVIRPYRNES